MNKDGIAGSTQQAVGALKETTGKTIGPPTLFIDGIAAETEGKMQTTSGGLGDTIESDLVH